MTNQQDNIDFWAQAVALMELALREDKEDSLFKLLLTNDEREAIGIRVQIVKELLAANINQRDLKDKLGTGIATITRGSNSLKEADSDFKAWLIKQLLNSDEDN